MTDKFTAFAVSLFVFFVWLVVAMQANYALDKPLEVDANQDGTIDASCVSCTVPGHLFFTPIYGSITMVNGVKAVEGWVTSVFDSVFLRDDPGTGFVPDNETIVETAYVDGSTNRECVYKAWNTVPLEGSGAYKIWSKQINDSLGRPVDKCWVAVTKIE